MKGRCLPVEMPAVQNTNQRKVGDFEGKKAIRAAALTDRRVRKLK
jgi:hypothetical protein